MFIVNISYERRTEIIVFIFRTRPCNPIAESRGCYGFITSCICIQPVYKYRFAPKLAVQTCVYTKTKEHARTQSTANLYIHFVVVLYFSRYKTPLLSVRRAPSDSIARRFIDGILCTVLWTIRVCVYVWVYFLLGRFWILTDRPKDL